MRGQDSEGVAPLSEVGQPLRSRIGDSSIHVHGVSHSVKIVPDQAKHRCEQSHKSNYMRVIHR